MANITEIDDRILDLINKLDNFPVDALTNAAAECSSEADYGDLLCDEEKERIYDAGGNDEDVESLEVDTSEVLYTLANLATYIAERRGAPKE